MAMKKQGAVEEELERAPACGACAEAESPWRGRSLAAKREAARLLESGGGAGLGFGAPAQCAPLRSVRLRSGRLLRREEEEEDAPEVIYNVGPAAGSRAASAADGAGLGRRVLRGRTRARWSVLNCPGTHLRNKIGTTGRGDLAFICPFRISTGMKLNL
ncbi:Hypothetical predicted protein [Podarcis lilfordi]|uniref:Uncharacterized protein n=1 Tax=Podarcis lilfordi TaxID=74358 RepID=A0AA35L8U1_9SAUR|nr:Hypothetical predicted protein [Podarcis lilfordi]